ncbi:MAG TPA: glutathione S-transferase family protein [Pseudomonadales bacterium]
MYTLYIANKNYSSWSLRPWLLLRELGIPFEERVMPFEQGGSFEKFRAFSPTGRVPCLHDGETVVWDSLAITEYLAERHPGVWPADPAARAWARSASAEMHSGFGSLRHYCSMCVALRIRLHERPEALERDVARIGELWNEGLERFGGPFLAGGEFTAVDAFYAPVAFRVRGYGLELPGRAADYPAHMLGLAGMRDWEAAALAEPWRDDDHEKELAAAGEWLEDRRRPAGS